MTRHDQIQEALRRVACARRTLALAREVQAKAFNLSIMSDTVVALAKQLREAELEAARLIGPKGASLGDGYVSVAISDRRSVIRPQFSYRHSKAMEVVS